MTQLFAATNDTDPDGNPNGGHVELFTEPEAGVGHYTQMPALHIRWQQGPLVVDGVRHEPNGVFVETVLEAVRQRIEYYQTTKFACDENERMIAGIDMALAAARDRTRGRQARGVEGTTEE